jgi:hypothetical protein
MPLYPDAESIIKTNLGLIQVGLRASVRPIGRLTDVQHNQINELRASLDWPPLIDPEVLYMGRHHYTSRSADGYSIEDMWLQIAASIHETCVIHGGKKMTAIQATTARPDGYGNLVHDTAVLELSARKPKAELLSCIPKGDKLKPWDAKNTKALPAEPEGPCLVIPGN